MASIRHVVDGAELRVRQVILGRCKSGCTQSWIVRPEAGGEQIDIPAFDQTDSSHGRRIGAWTGSAWQKAGKGAFPPESEEDEWSWLHQEFAIIATSTAAKGGWPRVGNQPRSQHWGKIALP